MSSSKQRKYSSRGQTQQSSPQQGLWQQPKAEQNNHQQPYAQQQALGQPWNLQILALPQNQQQFLQPLSTSSQMFGQHPIHAISWVPQLNGQQIHNPQAFVLGTNQSGAQTHSTTTTTTTTTGQTISGQPRNQPSSYINQQPPSQPAQQQQYNKQQPYIAHQPMPQLAQQSLEEYNQQLSYTAQQAKPQPAQQSVQQSQTPQQASDYTELAKLSPVAPQAPQQAQRVTNTTSTATTTQATVAGSQKEQRKAQREDRLRQRKERSNQLPQPPSQPAQLAQPSNTTSTTRTTTQTTVAQTQREQRKAEREERLRQRNEPSNADNVGGKARQDAAAKGDAELRRFDQTVQEMLMSASRSTCPMGFKYYRGKTGYLCGGGSHFVSHADVDNMVLHGTPPDIEIVNDVAAGDRAVAPPAHGWHEPMHMSPFQRLANGYAPLPLKHDGSEHRGYRQALAEFNMMCPLEDRIELRMEDAEDKRRERGLTSSQPAYWGF